MGRRLEGGRGCGGIGLESIPLGSGGQWLIVPSSAHPKDVCGWVGAWGEREEKGGLLTTSARFTTDLAKLLVRTTDCRICSNWEKNG